MKHQIVLIHGGDTFETYEEYIEFLKTFEIDFAYLHSKDWKKTLDEKLGPEFEVIAPSMPDKSNAKFLEWKIWFEKFVPILKDDVVLVGHSLGGIFLAKYLSENSFPKRIKAVFLVAAPFDAADSDYTLADFVLPKSLERFAAQVPLIRLYHSSDDSVVPFKDLAKYKTSLPSATVTTFTDRDHFFQEQFPEIVRDIKNLFA